MFCRSIASSYPLVWKMDKPITIPTDKMEKVEEELKNLGVHERLISAAEHICIYTPMSGTDYLDKLQSALKQGGIETCIRNALVLAERMKDVREDREHLSYIKKVQNQFERKIGKSLMALHKELKIPFIRPRNNTEVEELSAKWNELSTYDQDVAHLKNIYSPKDLYDSIASIRDPDNVLNRLEEKWSTIQVQMKIPNHDDLRELFKELCSDEPYLGLGSHLVSENHPNVNLLSQRIVLGTKVLAENDILLSEEFIKGGCPPHLRGSLWKHVLQTNVGEKEKAYFEARRQSFIQTEYLTDKIIIKDILLTSSRDEHYFIFEDLVYQVGLCFSRDSYVCQQLCSKFGIRPHSRHVPFQIPGHSNAFPPSGCIPFYGWAMYVAPLCYVYEEVEDIYFTLRSMYLKYWYRLHRISSSNQSLVVISVLFERLLQKHEPELWMHCLNSNIEALKIAFPWMVQAFSGYLIPEQLLYLWDLILGYDCLYFLPLLAAAIFSLRRNNLMRVKTHEAAEHVCQDLSTIKVIPLLKMALGPSGLSC